ncbi:MAG: hypothetical protein Q9163_003581 [Psora crenata]
MSRSCKRSEIHAEAPRQKRSTKRGDVTPRCKWESTATRHAPGFWDLLPKIHLTRPALQEFDRRNALEPKKAAIGGSSTIDLSLDLKRFARGGGPDLSHIIGASNQPRRKQVPASGGAAMECTEQESKSGRTSAYDSNFMKLLRKSNIRAPQRAHKPANFEQLRNRLLQRRASLTPDHFSEDRFDSFLDAVDDAQDEGSVMSNVLPAIKGDHRYLSTQNRLCNNWKRLASGKVVMAKPDFFDGARPGQQYQQIGDVLDSLIVPSTISECPFLPNFFGEVKAPTGIPVVAERQACYDGAFGARAMHHVRNYGAEETYDHNAHSFTFTYYVGILQLYAHHMREDDGTRTRPCYYMTMLGSWSLVGSRQQFACGAAAFRNLRDLASEMREQFLADAHRRIQGLPKQLRQELIAEAVRRAEGSLPSTSSSEYAIDSSPSGPSDAEPLQDMLSEADVNDTDRTVTREKRTVKTRRRKHSITSEARPRKKPALSPTSGAKTGLRKRPRVPKSGSRRSANGKANTQARPFVPVRLAGRVGESRVSDANADDLASPPPSGIAHGPTSPWSGLLREMVMMFGG